MYLVRTDIADPTAWANVARIDRSLGMPSTALVLNAARPLIGTDLTNDAVHTWSSTTRT